ncbi:MAG TPA: neprosin family prolyl endopeptidase [Ktedonobacteraceae bacterium]|nr:neprosin family prolyl endopeptidase [Ktedonobacteraceae bacterium]
MSSFVLDSQYFDCITVSSQPTVHYLHIKQIAKPPQVSTQTTAGKDSTHSSIRASRSPLALGQKDEFGNPIACKDGTIPMERITLERMSKFHTLHDFLAKEPGGRGTHSPASQSCDNPHCYAHAFQSVTNYGGNSLLNLWNPNPNGGFSLSQHWYAGGTGDNTQTAEGGWINYPDKFGTQLSVLFIYYTADNYKNTGCYNLDCTAFVQINNNWTLGGPFDHYSSYGGDQYGFTLQYKYYQGNWWLFLKGSGDYEAVGYYPGSIYNNGQLASNAQEVDYGGETYTSGSDLPQMGSGNFASQGWQQAAFQNTIFYIPRDENGGTGVWTDLTPNQTNTNCYTIIVTPSSSGGDWGTYFYFGGPGGNC